MVKNGKTISRGIGIAAGVLRLALGALGLLAITGAISTSLITSIKRK